MPRKVLKSDILNDESAGYTGFVECIADTDIQIGNFSINKGHVLLRFKKIRQCMYSESFGIYV
ncbi:MAG TPA: hypothetical protein PKL77_10630 [Candidatus Omnitrophota bacterium]|nr:hypothetical protein [Candidatus Omnitrophota bacterium]